MPTDKNVLVVSYEESIAQLLADVLEMMGFEAITIKALTEQLNEEEPFDLCIVVIHSNLSDWKATLAPNCKVIHCDTQPRESNAIFVQMPFKLEYLERAIAKALNN